MAAPAFPPPSTSCVARGMGGKIWEREADMTGVTPVCLVRNAPSETRPLAAPLIAAAFNKSGEYLATLDKRGRLVVFMLHSNRYAVVRRGGAHGLALLFSFHRRSECFVSFEDGTIECLDTESKKCIGVLRGHAHGAHSLACHPNHPLLASAAPDALFLWCTTQLTRLRVLSAPPSRTLHGVMFAPLSNTLATLSERGVALWDVHDYRALGAMELPASTEHGQRLRTFAFNSDATLVAAAGLGGCVALWETAKRELLKLIKLPQPIVSVAQVQFISWRDSGASVRGSRGLALVGGDGAMHIINASEERLVSSFRVPWAAAIAAVAFDPLRDFAACILADGTLALFRFEALLAHADGVGIPLHTSGVAAGRRLAGASHAPSDGGVVEKYVRRGIDWERASRQLQGVSDSAGLPLFRLGEAAGILSADSMLLDVPRLRALVRSMWQFPSKHRLAVWKFLLQLPYNDTAHAGLLARGTHPAFENILEELPIERRMGMRLERLLSSLAHWCPLFAEATDLSTTVFPWLLTFGADGVGAFEAAATVLNNWCRHFYTCHPNPPIEVLGAAANLLEYHVPHLSQHLTSIGAGPDVWAWPLLQSLFGRVLQPSDWSMLWDHLLCQEPRFFLVALVGFLKMHSAALLLAWSADDVAHTLLRPSAVQMRAWLRLSYGLADTTPTELLPSWEPFRPIPKGGAYPVVHDFPNSIVDHGAREVERIRREEAELMRKRLMLSSRLAEVDEADAQLQKWREKEEQMAAAEAAQRKAILDRQMELQRLAEETTRGMKEEAFMRSRSLAERQLAFEESREKVHALAMQQMRDQIATVEAIAETQEKVAAESLRLEKTRAASQDHAQQMEQALREQRARQDAERQADARCAEQLLQANTENVALQAAVQLRVAEVDDEVRRSHAMRSQQLEAVRAEEEELSRLADDLAVQQRKVLSAEDVARADALLAEQKEWMAARQRERDAILALEVQAVKESLQQRQSMLREVERAQNRTSATADFQTAFEQPEHLWTDAASLARLLDQANEAASRESGTLGGSMTWPREYAAAELAGAAEQDYLGSLHREKETLEDGQLHPIEAERGEAVNNAAPFPEAERGEAVNNAAPFPHDPPRIPQEQYISPQSEDTHVAAEPHYSSSASDDLMESLLQEGLAASQRPARASMRSQAEVPAVRRAQRSGGQRTRVPHVGAFGPALDDHLEITEEESGYAEGSDTSSASHPCPCSRPYGVAFSSSASSLPRELVPVPTPFEPTPREASEAQSRNFGPPGATVDVPAWQPPPPMQSASSPARRRSEPGCRGFREVLCPDSPAALGDEDRMASAAGAPVEATWHDSAEGGQMDTAQHLPEVEQLALDASILAELRLLADAGRLSGERLGSFTPCPEPGSRASTDSSGLGALRLSGLDSDLKQLLRQQARSARNDVLREDPTQEDDSQSGSASLGAYSVEADDPPRTRVRGSSTGGASSSCPTCDRLRGQFAENEQCVESLKASAEAVFATHQRTRQQLDELMPGGGSSSSNHTGDSST